jgi:hypothetical protein
MRHLCSGPLVLVLVAAACRSGAVEDKSARARSEMRAKQDSIFAACQSDEAEKHTAFRATPGWNAERALDEIKRQIAYCQARALWKTR